VSSRLDNIARRKQALIEKAALERLELTTACRRIRSPIDIDGKLFGIGRIISSHPLLAAGLSTFLIGGFGKKIFRITSALLKLWRVVLPILNLWPKRRRSSWRWFGRNR
jgi:hypothetical protein